MEEINFGMSLVTEPGSKPEKAKDAEKGKEESGELPSTTATNQD